VTAPLEGIRVLDWTIWQQGPVASAMLADMGAEVIKIEDSAGGDPGRGLMRQRGISTELPGGRNCYTEYTNHNKKSMTINLKSPRGREVAYRLVEKSDVFVQNFRKGVAARLGMDYATLSRHNARIICANASGYGPKGPDSCEPSFDYLALARSGIMTAIGEAGMPPLSMVGGVADQMGAVMLAYGIMTALFVRERTGVGQELDVSILSAMIALQGMHVATALLLKRQLPGQERARAFNPIYNHYECRDGKWIALAHPQVTRYWPALCRVLGIEEMINDPRMASHDAMEKNCESLVAKLDRVFATRTRDEWMKALKEGGDFIYSPVNSVIDLSQDPQVIENEYISDFDHPALGKVKVVGLPVVFSKTPGAITRPAPEYGQNTEEVLRDVCGYSWEEITCLKEEQAI